MVVVVKHLVVVLVVEGIAQGTETQCLYGTKGWKIRVATSLLGID